MENKQILNAANKAVSTGDNEGFLQYCTEDTHWTFVGDITLQGKESVRKWMKENYIHPPVFDVKKIIAESEHVTAIGKITIKNEDGKEQQYDYCDVWRFRDGKMFELMAYVIKKKVS